MGFIQRNNRQQQPKNRPLPNIARSSLDAITPLAQEQYNNALAVNGVPILFYSRMRSGIPCTCSSLTPQPSVPAVPGDPYTGSNKLPTEPGQMKPLDPQGFGTDEYINSMLEGSTVVIRRYGARTDSFEIGRNDNPQRALPHSPRDRSLEKELKNSSYKLDSGDIDDPFIDELQPVTVDDFLGIGLDGGTFASNATTGCAVCMGTGYVGGFTLVNGVRLVFDTQYQGWSTSGFVLQPTRPKSWEALGAVLGKDGITAPSATIRVLLPKGAVGVDSLRLFNNTTVLDNIKFYIESNGVYVPLTGGQDLLDYCDGAYHVLRIEFPIPDDGSAVSFTHLELQFDMGQAPIYCEFSRLIESENLELPENVDPQNLVISPLVPVVRIYDIIVDTTYERVWKLTNVQTFHDRVKNPHGWEAGARLVQKFELTQLLALRKITQRHNKFAQPNRYKPETNNYQPYTDWKQTLER